MHWLRANTPSVPRADRRLEPFQPTYAEHREDACEKSFRKSCQKPEPLHGGMTERSEVASYSGNAVSGGGQCSQNRSTPTPENISQSYSLRSDFGARIQLEAGE